MSQGCGGCIRWRRRQPGPRDSWRWSGFGHCRWPGTKPEPYWRAEHPGGELMVHQTHGAACPAFRPRKK